jgi:hypothetical protein
VPLQLRRAAAPPSAVYATDATLSLYPNGSVHSSRTPVAVYTARADATGRFSVQVAGGLDGRYDVVVKPAGALSRERNSVYFSRGEAKTLDQQDGFGVFGAGDTDGDDVVGAADLARLQAAFGSASGDAAFDPACDLDRDGRVTLLDFSLLARSYGFSGPQLEP